MSVSPPQLWPQLLLMGAALVACGNSTNDSATQPSGGGQGGTSGTPSAAGMAGAALGGTTTAGGTATAGTATSSAGASGTATGGAATSGAPTGGAATAGAAGSAGAAGTPGNCTGNSLSLQANGTGSASDAAQARVVIDLGSDTPTGAANRTIEFWMYVRASDWLGERNQVYYSGGAGTNTTFGLDFGTNPVMGMPTNHATLDPFTNGSLSVDSTADLGIDSSAAQWLHVAMSWDGAAVKTYANGTLRITSTASATLATAQGPLIMGCNPGNSYCFSGSFDELRVWSRALSDAEIKAMYDRPLVGNEQGLIGYYKFDEQPGASTAADSVTSANHTAHPGTLLADTPANQPTFVTPTPATPLVCQK